MQNVIVICDNEVLDAEFRKIISKKKLTKQISIFKSVLNENTNSPTIDLTKDHDYVIKNFKVLISLHCKQIVPSKILKDIPCINIHPGFNPYNRGMFPHVFSIINKKPAGITIHLMDEKIDNGNIIFQKEIEIFKWDTSESLYNRILDLELRMIDDWILKLINTDYTASSTPLKGKINNLKKYHELKRFDLDEKNTFEYFFDKMRALSHGNHKNSYVIINNKKVFFKISIQDIQPHKTDD